MLNRPPSTSLAHKLTGDAAELATPRLRFPAFKLAEGWDVRPLGQLFAERQESGFVHLPLLSVTDRDGVIPQAETGRRNNSNADKSKYLRVVPGDIAYNTMRMWEGRSALVGLEGLVSPAYTVCQPAPGINGGFFAYYFKTPGLIAQFRRYSQGLVEDTLNLKYDAFAGIPVATPCPDEQQKIADCLTSLDEVIAAQGRKVEALKAHKKGLMQHLFPQEGQTLPRLRFPEFRDGPEWEVKPLAQVGDTLPGLGGKAAEDFGEGERYVTYKQVFNAPLIDRAQCGRVRVAANERQTRLRYGDVLITGSSETPGEVGWASIVLDRSEEALYLNSFCFAFRLKDHSALVPEFAKHLFHSPAYRSGVRVLAQGAIRYNISKSGFLAIPLPVPPDPAEQERIANCLASLDAAIASAAAALAALKTHKKGLMHGLFPTAHAATPDPEAD